MKESLEDYSRVMRGRYAHHTGKQHKLRDLLKRHDPIELKASIETKLKGLYAQRARLLAEEQEEQTEATTPTPSVQRKNT